MSQDEQFRPGDEKTDTKNRSMMIMKNVNNTLCVSGPVDVGKVFLPLHLCLYAHQNQPALLHRSQPLSLKSRKKGRSSRGFQEDTAVK